MKIKLKVSENGKNTLQVGFSDQFGEFASSSPS